MKTLLKAALLPALLLCAGAAAAGQRTVRIDTADGCRLEAFYLAPASGAYVFINSHGLGSDKNEWGRFQDALKKEGYGYLSLDLRGHGNSRSCGGKKTAYMYFSKEEWNKVSADIEAAAAWLKARGVPPARQVFCGASIGANLSIKAAAEGAYKPAAVILLSPGLEYAGVMSEPYFTAQRLFPVLTAAAPEDGYAWYSVMRLNEAARAKGLRSGFVAGDAGHGVNMFKSPRVIPEILDWVSALRSK